MEKTGFPGDPWPVDEAPFLREIRAYPDDDAPRLVFADWLEEQGDPRAGFIRAQCALAPLRLADPNRRPHELAARALWDEFGETWRQRLPQTATLNWGIPKRDWAESPVEWRLFVRGMPVAACFRPFTFASLRSPSELDELGITEWRLPRLTAADSALLTRSPRLNTFRGLTVGTVCHHELFGSERLENVERLHFNADQAWPLLSRNTALQRLRSLHYQLFPPEALSELAAWKQLPALRELCLEFGRGDQGDFPLFVSSPALAGLDELAINGIADADAACRLTASPHLSQLASLSLADLPAGGAQAVLATCNLPQLTRLGLRHTPLGSIGTLLDAPWYPRLRALDLRDADLTDADVIAIAEHPGSANLEWLDLTRNSRVGSAGVAALCHSPYLRGLRHLGLWNHVSRLRRDDAAKLQATFGSRVVLPMELIRERGPGI